MNFRTLTENDVELRVARAWQTTNGHVKCSLLLYKDARVDRSILNETVGQFGWKSRYELINGNLFCAVAIKDNESGEWIEKMDVGTESNTEAEKGQASDAFKRACFAWGIGEELYSCPKVDIDLFSEEFELGGKDKYGKPTVRPYNNLFKVARIDVDPITRKVRSLVIIDRQQAPSVRFFFNDKPTFDKVSENDIVALANEDITMKEMNEKYYITRKEIPLLKARVEHYIKTNNN